MIRNYSLVQKIIIFTTILVVVAVMLTAVVSFFISRNIIFEKMHDINGMLSRAAVYKTNTILGEIGNIVNLAIKEHNLDYIMDHADVSSYQWNQSREEYEKYLKGLIMNYHKVDAIIIVNEKESIRVLNTSMERYDKYTQPDFYRRVKDIVEDDFQGQFFLDKYVGRNQKRIGVIAPIFEPYTNKAQACIVVVLNDKFLEELQFAGDIVVIEDQLGNYATLPDNDEFFSDADERFSIEENLIYDGWRIIDLFSNEGIIKDINSLLIWVTITSFFYIVTVIIMSILVSKKIVYPLRMLKEKIKDFNATDLRKFNNKLTRRLRFRTRLLFFYILVVVIPVVGITGGIYFKSQDIIKNKIGSVFDYNIDILCSQLDFIFKNHKRTISEISVNPKIQEMINIQHLDNISEETINETGHIILYKQMGNRGIKNVALYNKNYDLLYSAVYSRSFMTQSYLIEDFRYIKNNYGEHLWKKVSDNYFNNNCYRIGMQIRGVIDTPYNGRFLGYAFLDFSDEEIRQVMDVIRSYEGANVFLLDKQGKNVIDMNPTEEAFLSSVGDISQLSDGQQFVSPGGSMNEYLIFSKTIPVNGWNLVVALPMQQHFKEYSQLLSYSFLVLSGLLLLSIILSYGFSYIIGMNISALLDMVRKVKQGDLKVRFMKQTKDEIGELADSFNEMLDRLNYMIDEKIVSETKIKDAEIKARENELNLLQAQINPHFLYNSLKTVQYMVYTNDERSVKMIKLLIYLFKTGINRGEKLVPVEEEIKHVQTYIDIQQMRFSNKFNVEYRGYNDFKQYYILKLTLQPIVENAIYHGLELAVGQGHILIDFKIVENKFTIRICDDGLGMEEDKLQQLQDMLSGKKFSKSIGIINVHERIRLRFGVEYGINIWSKKNKGTKVNISFPIIDSLESAESVKKSDDILKKGHTNV